MNVLIARPTPRGNIEEVEKWNGKLGADTMLVRYYSERPAYKLIQDYFMDNDYDYLVIAPDDLVVKPLHVKQLLKDLAEGFDIIGGVANVDENDKKNISSCRSFEDIMNGPLWITRDTMPNTDIFPVVFNGFALLAIHRNVLEVVKFRDGKIDVSGKKGKGSVDTCFCVDAQKHGFKIYTDKRIDMKHLREQGINKVGIRLPRVVHV